MLRFGSDQKLKVACTVRAAIVAVGGILLFSAAGTISGQEATGEMPPAPEAPTMEDFLDPGLAAVRDNVTPLNLSETVGDFTITLDWAYADANRLAIAYRVAGDPAVQYANLLTPIENLTITDEAGNAIIGDISSIGMGAPRFGDTFGLINGNIEAEPGTTLTIGLTTSVQSITAEQRTAVPDSMQMSEITEQTDSVTFTFDLPVFGTLRELAAPQTIKQTVTDQEIAVTLEAFRVSNTMARATICFEEPEAERTWTSIPFVQVGGDELMPGTVVNYLAGERAGAYNRSVAANPPMDTAEATADATPAADTPARTCDDIYFVGVMPRYDEVETWTVEVRELVGFGSGGGGDQNRIAGSWVFTVELPRTE